MDNLAKCLRYYVADRLSNDPGWSNVTVSVTLLFRLSDTARIVSSCFDKTNDGRLNMN